MIRVVIKFANNDEIDYKCSLEQGKQAISDWYNGESYIAIGKNRITCNDDKGRQWIKEIIFCK